MIHWESRNERLIVDGNEVPFLDSVRSVVEIHGILVVLTSFSIGDKADNANLYGVDGKGKLIWRIQPRPHPRGGDNPVTLLRLEGKMVLINFWEGICAILDPETGDYDFPESQGRPW